jgi:hypothetical protein
MNKKKRIDLLENFEVNIRIRQQISVESLSLKRRLKDWRHLQTPERTCQLLGNELMKVLNPRGLNELIVHIVRIDRPDLMIVLLNTGDMSDLYTLNELNKCYDLAKSRQMRDVIIRKTRDLTF